MARLKVPGGKVGRPRKSGRPSAKSKFKIAKSKDRKAAKLEIKPQVISRRLYREIFGDSDDEEEDFYGFCSEELGLIAYRSFSTGASSVSRLCYTDLKNGVPSSRRTSLSRNLPRKLPPQTPPKSQGLPEARDSPSGSPTDNIYAKQYKRRETYERKFSPLSKPRTVVEQKSKPNSETSLLLKSTPQVKFNFVTRRVTRNISLPDEATNDDLEKETKSVVPPVKRTTASVAQMLLAKAKGSKLLQLRKQQQANIITTNQTNEQPQPQSDASQVRSRSGRVVKAKKRDYDDLTSPKYEPSAKGKGETAKTSQPQASIKRELENGEMPTPKVRRLDREASESLAGSKKYGGSDKPEKPKPKAHKARLKYATVPLKKSNDSISKLHTKVKIKNAFVAHSSEFERALFPVKNQERRVKPTKRLTVRLTDISEDDSQSDAASDRGKGHRKASKGTLRHKRSSDKELQSDGTTDSEISFKKDIPPRKFESQRLQELTDGEEDTDKGSDVHSEDESLENETPQPGKRKRGESKRKGDQPKRKVAKLDTASSSEEQANDDDDKVDDDDDAESKRAKRQKRKAAKQTVESSSESSAAESSEESSEESSDEDESSEEESEESSDDSGDEDWKCPESQKKQVKKSAPKNEGASDSETSDEDSTKPLAVLQQEIKESPEKIVTKLIKIVKKVKLKNGQVKNKSMKVTKKVRKAGPEQHPKVLGKRRRRCGECAGCLIEDDCGKCQYCRDKPKYGGPGVMKQACADRRCLRPQAPGFVKIQKDGTRKSLAPKRPKKPKARKLTLKTKDKRSKSKKKEDSKKMSSETEKDESTEASAFKKQFKRTRDVANVNNPLVKLSWSDNASEENIWKGGFALCFTTGAPEEQLDLCFLCGSSGRDKMYYCKVCAEAFHGFCLDEEPIDEVSWCCDNCSTCVVCGQQDKLLMCDKCQRGYHVECLGPNYPTEPEGSEDAWICGRCVQCTRCGSKSAGQAPEATWLHEFSHCYDCGTAWDLGNYCPICEKCYSDTDFDSKMMHCNDCEHWVHASCQNINPDEYECLSDLPESIPFVCKVCCNEENPKWHQEMIEEMQAGYQRILDEMERSKGFQPLISFCNQVQFDNGHPKDLDSIRGKVKEHSYRIVGDFCRDVLVLLNKVCELVRSQNALARNVAILYEVFIKEVGSMFPWHKIKSAQQQQPVSPQQPEPNFKPRPGAVGPPVDYAMWDHIYSAPPSKQPEEPQQDADKAVLKPEDKMDVDKTMDGSLGEKPVALGMSKSCDSTTNHKVIKEWSETIIKEPILNNCIIEADKTGKPGEDTNTNKTNGITGKQDTNVPGKVNKNNIKISLNKTSTKAAVVDGEVMDSRKCQLCCRLGDDEPSRAGRLLYSALDEWVHINCGLWSAEVFEDDEGRLQNVQAAVTRGKLMKCEHCGEAGATVGCCENRCPMNYHFMCGREADAVHQDDKKVYCAQHAFRAKEDLILKGEQFHVARRVCIDMSKVRTFKKGLKGAEPQTIQLMQGSLKVENLGKLTESSDLKAGVFPIGYKVSRLYWSVVDPTRRCRYYCTINEKPKSVTKTCAEDTGGMATIEDTQHRVIAHDDKDKPERCTEKMNSHADPKGHRTPVPNRTAQSSPCKDRTGNKTTEITRILSGLKQILPSIRPPPPLFKSNDLCGSSPLTSPRKILPNIQQSVRFPSMYNQMVFNNAPCGNTSLPPPLLPKGAAANKAKTDSTTTNSTPRRKPRMKNPGMQGERKSPTASKAASPSVCTDENCQFSTQCRRKLVLDPSHDKTREYTDPELDNANIRFTISNDDGLKIEADSYKVAWKMIFNMVREARTNLLLKDIPFIGLSDRSMIGIMEESVVYMLEQLPGAHQLSNYQFTYNPPFGTKGEFGREELKENRTGCCRTESYHRRKKLYDMFAFLASEYRTPPQMGDNNDDQEASEQAYGNALTAKRDLPMAMQYRHLKQNRYNRDTIAVYRSGIHGRGLYCARSIAAGEMVIEYSGMLIRSTLTDKREAYYESKGIGCYMFRIDGVYVVDATMSGNVARFINHSCEPNCFSRVINIDGKKKILIFASRSISRGEELTYDYKFPIEDDKLPCHCNSKRCRKYLN